jgi:hypothetical protein
MISINQPYFFPNIGYFLLLNQCSTHVFLDHVNMKKKSFITRNYLHSLNVKIFVPLRGLSQNRMINEHDINDYTNYTNQLFDKILKLYVKYPFFDDLQEIVDDIQKKICSRSKISEFNAVTTQALSEFLGLKVKFYMSSDLKISSEMKKSDLLIEICQKLGYGKYINLAGGKDLYDSNAFKTKGIDIFFSDNSILTDNFTEDLIYTSILDLIALKGRVWITEQLNSRKNKLLGCSYA